MTFEPFHAKCSDWRLGERSARLPASLRVMLRPMQSEIHLTRPSTGSDQEPQAQPQDLAERCFTRIARLHNRASLAIAP